MSRNRRSHHDRKTSAGIAAGDRETARGKALTVVLTAVPMIAAVGYGAVDFWALIPLSLLTSLIVVLWTTDSLRSGYFRFSRSPLQLPILGLILIGCVQLLPIGNPPAEAGILSVPAAHALTLDPFSTGYFTIRLLLLFVFFAAALTFLNGKRRSQRIVVAIIVFGSIMAFGGILLRLTSPDAIYGMRPTPQAIPFGPFVNQHHFAAFMEMTIGLAFAMLLGGTIQRDKKALLAIALALMMIAIIMTGSRGGMLATAAVAAFVLALGYATTRSSAGPVKKNWLLKVAAAAGLVFFIAAGAAMFLSGADPLLRGLGIENRASDLTGGRLHFWSMALKIFFDHPVLGAGFDAFGVAFTRYDTWHGYFRVEQAHNDYLQILADGGVLAFACVAAFVYLLLRRGTDVIRSSSSPTRQTIAIGALAGCFGILIHSFFDFPLRTISNSYFFLLLAALATVDLGDEREHGK